MVRVKTKRGKLETWEKVNKIQKLSALVHTSFYFPMYGRASLSLLHSSSHGFKVSPRFTNSYRGCWIKEIQRPRGAAFDPTATRGCLINDHGCSMFGSNNHALDKHAACPTRTSNKFGFISLALTDMDG